MMTFDKTLWSLDTSVRFRPIPFTSLNLDPTPLFEISSPLSFGTLQATALQLHLLWSFVVPQALDKALHHLPTERESSLSFLLKCRAAGILRPTDPTTRLPHNPDRVPNTHTFLDTPSYDPEAPTFFTVLGIPIDSQTTGQPGTRFGPTIIRSASLGIRYTLDPLTQVPLGFYDFGSRTRILSGASIADAGDIFIAPGENMNSVFPRIHRVLSELTDAGSIPIVLGGDHSITAAVIHTLCHEPLQIIHLDAHTDLGPIESSAATSVHHGNVFSYILRNESHVEYLHQIGLRGYAEASADANESERLSFISIDQLRSDPAEALAPLVSDRATYLTIDIDVLDPAFAAHTGTPVANGLLPGEMRKLIQDICKQFRIVGMDLVEVSGTEGFANQTGALAVDILLTAAGGVFDQWTPKL